MSTELATIVQIDVSTKTYPSTFTVVDLDDFSILMDGKGRWIAAKVKPNSNSLYVVRGIGGRANRQFQLMHRVILGLRDSRIQSDHKNGDTLDNRRSNLRPSTQVQNSRNVKRRSNGTSKFKGVSWDKERNLWTVSIRGIDRPTRESLGRFKDEIEAAKAYDAVALIRYGEFARLNFPEECRGK